jgi:CheY-like chemotaxis protein
MNADLISVLLVDDDPGDVLLVREAFDDHKVGNLLSVVSDGVEALEYVRAQGSYSDAGRPDLILLDLNLPRKSGIEVLQEIKSDPELSTIPVVVLTTSEAEEDILRAYKLHANAYITKPVDFEQFTRIVHQIDEFFIGLVKLPPPPGRERRHTS